MDVDPEEEPLPDEELLPEELPTAAEAAAVAALVARVVAVRATVVATAVADPDAAIPAVEPVPFCAMAICWNIAWVLLAVGLMEKVIPFPQ